MGYAYQSETGLNGLADMLENDPAFRSYVQQWNQQQQPQQQTAQPYGAWFSSPDGENGEQVAQFMPMPKLAAGPGYGGAFPDEATVKNALVRPVPDSLPYHLQLQMMQARQPVLKDTVYQSPTTGSFARRTDMDRNATLSNIMKAEQGVNTYMTKAEDAALKRQKAMLGLETERLQQEQLKQQLLTPKRPTPPPGYMWNAEGTSVVKMPGFAGDEGKPLTEFEGKSAVYGTRAAQSDAIIHSVGKDGEVQPSLIKQVAETVPLVGGALGMAANKFAANKEQQQIEQAQRDFINATLRQESGAAISPQEFDNARKQYFPQPGDSPEVIAQKAKNRQAVISGFKVTSGRGYDRMQRETGGNQKTGGQTFDRMPNPASMAGKTIQNDSTGMRYKSNGTNWVVQ